MRRLSRKLVEEAGPYGLPIVTLVSDLRKAGYYMPDTKYLIDLLPSLNLKVNLDGETIITN
jgi:hypothetical protein